MNLNDYTLNKPIDRSLSSTELKNLEKSCKKEFRKLFKERKLALEDIESLEKFLYGKRVSQEIMKSIYSINNSVRYCVTGRRIITLLNKIEEESILYERGIVVLTILREWHGIFELCFLDNEKEEEEKACCTRNIFSIFEKYKVPVQYRLNLIDDLKCKEYYYDKNSIMLDCVIKELINLHRTEVIECLKQLSIDGRILILEYIWREKSEENILVLLDNFNDSSKQVRNKIIDLLKDSPQYFEFIKDKLLSKNACEREVAINVLSLWKTKESVEALKDVSKIEKQQKLKNLIVNALKETSSIIEEKLSIKDIIKHLLSIAQFNKFTLSWINPKELPKVRFKAESNSNCEVKYCDEKFLKSLLLSYSATNLIEISNDGNILAENLDRKDLALLSNKILQLWIEKKCQADKKWVLIFASIYGDNRSINVIKTLINQWIDEQNFDIIKDALYALVLSNNRSALLSVAEIEDKCRYKQVKKYACDAWKFGAEQRHIDKTMLLDMAVPDFGFDEYGRKEILYGNRNLILRLNNTLDITLYEKNKMLKTIPAPSKNDREETQSIYKEFKTLKRQLNAIFNDKISQLEEDLLSGTKWTRDVWLKIFKENPVMKKLSEGFIWGIYNNDMQLVFTFRNIDNDMDYIQEKKDCFIGLAHRIELDDDEIKSWKDDFEKHDIVQSINQLDRPILKADNIDIDAFLDSLKINYDVFERFMNNHRWSKDNKNTAYYKKYKSYNIAAKLIWDKILSGGNEGVKIQKLEFYRLSKSGKDSNEIDDEKIVNYIEVPKRIFSEILYELNNIN